jgi:hypothetical protein
MDFVLGLPRRKKINDVIWVINFVSFLWVFRPRDKISGGDRLI